MVEGIRGWMGRGARPELHHGPVPTVTAPEREPDGEALYVGTTIGAWKHHKIVAGALFGRGRCRYWLNPGILVFQRDQGPTIGLTNITEVGLAGAHAGQMLAPNRIAIVTWRLGADDVDTGFGFDDAARAEVFADQVASTVGLSPDKGPHASA